MESNWFIIALVFALLLAGTVAWLFIKQRRQLRTAEKKAAPEDSKGALMPLTSLTPLMPLTDIGGVPSRQLQLQAYERLILLTDRIALPNLIQRANQPGLSAREMQSLLTLGIRQEFEHNITQQIYVSAEAWDAIRNYKEQNLLIVNQVASFLSEEASGSDLNRQLLDLLVQNPKASLQNVVAEVLSYEAKKLL